MINKYFDFLNEMKTREKKILGQGQDHIVYDMETLPNTIIKIKKPKGYDSLSFEIYRGDYKRCPNLMAKLYKMTDTYLLIEKLDNKKVKEEVKYMKDLIFKHKEIANMFNYKDSTTTKYNFDNYDFIYNIANTLPYAHTVKENPNKNHFKNIETILKLLKPIDNKCSDLLKKYIDFIWLCKENYICRDIDANNIGYDLNGNLKCLDV